jgi:PAS domain S-box-containing protein
MEDKNKTKEIYEIYKTIFDNAPDGIVLADVETKKFYIGNKMICRMLGYSLEEIKNLGIMDIHPEKDLPYVIEQFEKQTKKEIAIVKDLPVKRKDGSIFYADVNSVLITLSGKSYIAGIFRDTTERKKVENALLQSEQRLARSQEIAHLGSWELDLVTNELVWSDEVYRIFGLQPQEFGATYEAFLERVHPEDRASVDSAYSGSLRDGKDSYEIEHRIVRKGTGEVRWVHEKCQHERDANGKIIRSLGMVHDITERKKAEEELKKLTVELRRSNADLEQFAYAASHDLQEPLRGLASFAGLLEKHYKGKLDKKADEFIHYIVDDAKRMQMLIKDLLEYSQIDTKGKIFRITNCSVVLEEVIYNLRSAIEESGTQVTYDLLPTIMADASQLKSLFQNLIGNAIKFRSDKMPKIHISSKQGGNEWIFSVQDNGIGIDPQFFKKIYVIFQRLHSRHEYQGTGIGLAICNKIVERHGGRLWVESEAGKGSTFYFTIPDRRETS